MFGQSLQTGPCGAGSTQCLQSPWHPAGSLCAHGGGAGTGVGDGVGGRGFLVPEMHVGLFWLIPLVSLKSAHCLLPKKVNAAHEGMAEHASQQADAVALVLMLWMRVARSEKQVPCIKTVLPQLISLALLLIMQQRRRVEKIQAADCILFEARS